MGGFSKGAKLERGGSFTNGATLSSFGMVFLYSGHFTRLGISSGSALTDLD